MNPIKSPSPPLVKKVEIKETIKIEPVSTPKPLTRENSAPVINSSRPLRSEILKTVKKEPEKIDRVKPAKKTDVEKTR